jgi:uncharacterized protein (TIGR03435 family)
MPHYILIIISATSRKAIVAVILALAPAAALARPLTFRRRYHRPKSRLRRPMADFAAGLQQMAPGYIQLPAVDLTGLKDRFDFKLDWTPRAALDNGAGGLSLFGAIEALGLKLDSRKHPLDVIVVDHIERTPTEN